MKRASVACVVGGGATSLWALGGKLMVAFAQPRCCRCCARWNSILSNRLYYLSFHLFYSIHFTYTPTRKQKIQVARLYRKALKTLSSWIIDREIFLEEATNLRGRFDAERGVSNAKAVRMLKVSYMLFWRNLMCSLSSGGRMDGRLRGREFWEDHLSTAFR